MLHFGHYTDLETVRRYNKVKGTPSEGRSLSPAMIQPLVLMGKEGRIPQSCIPAATAKVMLRHGNIKSGYLVAYSGTPAKEHFANLGIPTKKSDEYLGARWNDEEGSINTYELTEHGRDMAKTLTACRMFRRLMRVFNVTESAACLHDPGGRMTSTNEGALLSVLSDEQSDALHDIKRIL